MVKKKIVTFMVVATMLSSVNVYAGENKDVDINLQNNSLESVQRDYGIKNQEDYQKIARFAIVSELSDIEISDIENLDMIELSNIIPLYNNEDMLAYSGMNFKIQGKEGYVIIANYMNERMIQEVCFDKNLDLSGEYYYFKEGNIIDISKNDEYINLKDGEKISQNEFNDLKQYSMTLYLEEQIDIKEIQEENQAQINNINFFSGEQLPEVRKTHYEGQDEGAYGYGGISNISTYLKDRYGGAPTYVSGKMLTMDNFLMSDLENNVNNCSLTAITRIARYYYTKGYTNIPANKNTIYKKVVSIAKGYGYTSDGGTFPTKINNIAQDLFRAYSYKSSSSNGIYVWTFNGQVKSEVDSNYPVIMNIARGYYGDHSVTVCGYKIYKIGSKTHNFIAVYDGWVNAVRYIDYEAFANDLITSGFGSFNTIRVK